MTAVLMLILSFGLSAWGASEEPLSIRQNHLMFDFVEEDGKPVCWIQEIVVVMNTGSTVIQNPQGTVRFSIPEHATAIAPTPLPPVMPGADATPPLREDEVTIAHGEFIVKRHLHPGKNSIAFQYKLPVTNDAVRIEKKTLLQTHLLAAFAPPVARLTSRALTVEKAEDGYKILGHSLAPGTLLDLTLEGVRAVTRPADARRDGSEMATGDPSGGMTHPPHGAMQPTPGIGAFVLPTLAGAILAVLVVLYVMQLNRAKASESEFRQHLMDEIEQLDAAAELKEITSEYHKRRKKALMDRLRSSTS